MNMDSTSYPGRSKRMAGGMEPIMDVYEAVTSRRAVRGFTDEPVSREVLERVLSAAAWAPSGSNIQPWNTYVMTGAPLAELKTTAVERVAHGDPWDKRQYKMYPSELKSPYAERRSAFGRRRRAVRHARIQSIDTRRAEKRNRLGEPPLRHQLVHTQAVSGDRHVAGRDRHSNRPAEFAQRA